MEGITFVPKLWSIKKLWDDRVAVVNQAKDIDAAEKVEINAFVAAELDLKNDKVEAIIEKTIEAILETTGVIDKIVELRNLIQEAKEAS